MSEDRITNLLKNLPGRLEDVLQLRLNDGPDHPALIESSGAWTYRQLAQAVTETQEWLWKVGARPGDRVIIVGENCRAFIAAWLATAALDAWPVLVSARISASELDQIRGHSGARLVLYIVAASPLAMKHASRQGAELFQTEALGRVGLGPVHLEALPEALEPVSSNNVAAMIYTSGTTGLPKGVMLSHRNLLFMALVSNQVRSIAHNDRLVGVLPMSHAVGLSVVLLGTLCAGATLYISPRFDPAEILRQLENERITVMLGTPSMFALLVEYAELKSFSRVGCPALRIISSSGAPLDGALKSRVESLFGMVLHNGYGVTECSPTIALTRPEFPRSDTSVGPSFPHVEVKLLMGEGYQQEAGNVGELCVRGPNVMRGYYRAPEETREVIDADGWFHTRDLARFEEGNLYIVGRTKELIVRFGFNVYPAEVEAVLNSHPAVLRSAVIGRTVPREEGEEVIAFVQKKDDCALTQGDLEEHAAKHLTQYKQPSTFIFVLAMPLTSTGKIVKTELRRMVEGISGK